MEGADGGAVEETLRREAAARGAEAVRGHAEGGGGGDGRGFVDRVLLVEPGADGVVEVAAQRVAELARGGRGVDRGVVGGVEAEAVEGELPHVAGEVVVDGPAEALLVGEEAGVGEQADGLGVLVARGGGADVLVRPAEEDAADARLVVGGERGVDPVDGEPEGFAPGAGPVERGESDVAEGRGLLPVRVRALLGLADHDHQEVPRPDGVRGARSRVRVDQREEGEELGEGLGGAGDPVVDARVRPAGVGLPAGVELLVVDRQRLPHGGDDAALPDGVLGGGPAAQAREVGGGDPEAGVPGERGHARAGGRARKGGGERGRGGRLRSRLRRERGGRGDGLAGARGEGEDENGNGRGAREGGGRREGAHGTASGGR